MSENAEKTISLLVKQKSKLIKFAIIIALLLVTVLIIFFKGYSNATKKYEEVIAILEEENAKLSDPVVQHEVATKEISIDLINSEISDIGELATVEYLYTDAGKFESAAELFGKELPFSFTTKSFIAKWDGAIKAGVDVSQVVAEENALRKEIIIYIPNAQILSHEIDSNSIETLDEKDGLFNPLKIDDVRIFDSVSKEAMEQRAIENGILGKAFENAKEIIYRLVNTGVVEELGYSIVFEVIEEK